MTSYAGDKVVLFDDHLDTFGEVKGRAVRLNDEGRTHGHILLRGLIW